MKGRTEMESNRFAYFRGYLQIRIKSSYPERFFNICASRNIRIWEIHPVEEAYEGFILISDFKKLLSIVRKTSTKLSIRNRCGFPFFLRNCRKRKGYIIGFLFFFLILYYSSCHIWEIHIEGNQIYSNDILIDYLEDCGVSSGMNKGRVSCPEIERLLRNQYEDITWVSASIAGSRLLIRIQENTDIEFYHEENPAAAADLIADHDAVITSIITRSGTPLVKKGDVVKKGEILVSSEVVILDDFGSELRRDYVQADADILGEVLYSYQDKQPYLYEYKQYTGNEKNGYAVTFGNNRIFLWVLPVQYEAFDCICDLSKVRLGANFYLPISLEKWYYKEYAIYQGEYSKEEAEQLLLERKNQNFQNFIEKGLQIIKNDVKIAIEKNEAVASGTVVVQQKIGKKTTLMEYQTEHSFEETEESFYKIE